MILFFLSASCVFVLPEEREAHLCDVGLADARFGDSDGDGTADCLDVEECDGLDNDGDGIVDEGLYPDEDGDGYGDESVTTDCFVGWVPTPGDCDDADAFVNPGAPFEICDGKNTLCAADWVEDLDVVTLYPRDPDTSVLGEPSDVTDAFMNLSPATVTLFDGELLSVCPARAGAYAVTLQTASNVSSVGIHGVLPGDGCDTAYMDELPTLSGAGGDTPVTLQGSARGALVDIDCLGITGGGVLGAVGGGLVVGPHVEATVTRSAIWGNTGPWFGGVWNKGGISLADVAIYDNSVQDAADGDGGGGIRSEGVGALEVIGGVIAGNGSPYGGGGVTVIQGAAGFYGTVFGGDLGRNYARYGGGALSVRSLATVELRGVRIEGNGVEYTQGGAILTAGDLTCSVDADGLGDIVDNTAAEGGVGGIYMEGGIVRSYGCNYAGNTGTDLYIAPIAASYVLGSDTCLVCDTAGCTELPC